MITYFASITHKYEPLISVVPFFDEVGLCYHNLNYFCMLTSSTRILLICLLYFVSYFMISKFLCQIVGSNNKLDFLKNFDILPLLIPLLAILQQASITLSELYHVSSLKLFYFNWLASVKYFVVYCSICLLLLSLLYLVFQLIYGILCPAKQELSKGPIHDPNLIAQIKLLESRLEEQQKMILVMRDIQAKHGEILIKLLRDASPATKLEIEKDFPGLSSVIKETNNKKQKIAP